MLPNIHHQNRIKAGDVSSFVQRNPVIGKATVGRILVADCPAHTAHLTDTHKISLPDVIAAETRFRRFQERRSLAWVASASSGLQVIEIVFMQHHTVEFKTKTPGQLRIRRHLVLIDCAVLDERSDSFA